MNYEIEKQYDQTSDTENIDDNEEMESLCQDLIEMAENSGDEELLEYAKSLLEETQLQENDTNSETEHI